MNTFSLKILITLGVAVGLQTGYGWRTTSMPEEVVDSVTSWVYTYGYVTIFSYADSNSCEIFDAEGESVWSDILREDEHAVIQCPDSGAYHIVAKKEIGIMSGNPFLVLGMGSWFAVGQENSPLSTKLLSAGPGVQSDPSAEISVVIFAYQDSTHVVFKNLEGMDKIIWEGDLDSADYYRWHGDGTEVLEFSVEASRSVSAVTGCMSVGTYAPAFNGTFTGQDFLAYFHYEDFKQDFAVIPWEDSTEVFVTDIDNPEDTLWQTFCEKKGQIKGSHVNENGVGPRAVFVHSDKDISVAQIPWATHNDADISFYSARAIDRKGSGLGTEYYLPLQMSLFDPLQHNHVLSRIQVVAYYDNTNVSVSKIPREGEDEKQIWEGIINRGEFYQYLAPLDDTSGDAIYHIAASDTVVVMGSSKGYFRYGSDFFPTLTWKSTIVVSEKPTIQTSRWQLVSSLGSQVVLRYTDYPDGFHAEVFDAVGRKVDEVRHASKSGTVTWGENFNPGVYFIRSILESPIATRKVVIVP